ncbi:MAG: V-type ATP synthase subunit A, partial [Gaiellaceae bacterium]
MSSPRVARVNGPVVEVANAETLAMLELVHVGAERLPGEVIARRGGGATVQVYEYTGGLRPGARVDGTGAPLVAAL